MVKMYKILKIKTFIFSIIFKYTFVIFIKNNILLF